MIPNNQKTSLLVKSQLPEYVRNNPDYDNFALFLEAYYEWLELANVKNSLVTTANLTDQGVLHASKNLLNYGDIDNTIDAFTQYYINEFIPFFPKESLISENDAIKYARELYRNKGTPAAFQFLFKILFNSDFDIYYTKDSVFKASDGKWYVPKSLKLATTDQRFLNINNYRLFGETSKSIATVEASVESQNKIEIFISNIQRLFQSGEFIRVVDNNNQDVLFDGEVLRAKIVGQLSQVNIDPKNRGLLYQKGDPVIVFGGLNTANGVGATAEVDETTSGSIQRINVIEGGFGYRLNPNTIISISNAPGANAIVGSVNPAANTIANVAFIPTDTINFKRFISLGANNYFFDNIAISNANTTLANALTWTAFSTFPISSVLVVNGGGGINRIPNVEALSQYENEAENVSNIASLGILAPIRVLNGGRGYRANDTIVFTGGSGRGAYANVLTVNSAGGILTVGYVPGSTRDYPIGGIGYKVNDLPGVSVNSSNTQANGASLVVPGILGEGASFSVVVNRVGSVTTIKLENPGEDYVATPNVSLKVQDIVVANVDISNLPQKGDVIIQGANINVATYIATVNSTTILERNQDPEKSLWNLRVFNYTSRPNTQIELAVVDKNINLVMANTKFNSNYNDSGVRTYGDGTAKATARFLNGLVIGQGQYLNSQGQASSYDVLQDEVYNNFTYQITVEKEIAKYRQVLMNLLHPTGMNVIGRYGIKSSANTDLHLQQGTQQGFPLYHYTGVGSYVTMTSDFTNKSNNIITFNDYDGADLNNFISIGNTIIRLTTDHGPNVEAMVVGADLANSKVTISSNVWLTFANIAVAQTTSGSNAINITAMTNAYSIINNGIYSDPNYPLKDIAFNTDIVLVNGEQRVINFVDYANGIIYACTTFTTTGNSALSLRRNLIANSNYESDQVKIFNFIGQPYSYAQLTTEDGTTITTEDGTILLVG